jgi:hypothetical protein
MPVNKRIYRSNKPANILEKNTKIIRSGHWRKAITNPQLKAISIRQSKSNLIYL